ncbi:hypothetical protein RB595_010418 [Gaeumannomyces hyphopodioides]
MIVEAREISQAIGDPTDWRGRDDPECPLNWPIWKRIYTASIPAFLCINVSFAFSIYTPGVDQVSEQFGVSYTASLLGLFLFLWALGFGAAIAAPRIALKPFEMLFVESIVLFITIYMAFNFTVFYSFFAAFPFVFGSRYGFTPSEQGLAFAAIALGYVIGFAAVVLIDRRTYPALQAKHGVGSAPPEHRLYGVMVGSVFNPAGLLWFG